MKKRLDILLLEKGLAESRAKAQALIMEGAVYIGGIRHQKAGENVSEDASIEIRGGSLPFVSRGGLKLQKALDVFSIDPSGWICSDSGASTGGFTDCLLQHGAAHVYAIDVGYGQLDWKIRNDQRVTVMERTNIRYVKPEDIGRELDFSTLDLSFISLRLVLPVIARLQKKTGQAVCLIKPQFEAGRDQVGKNGVVRDPAVHEKVLEDFFGYAEESGYTVQNLTYSPVKGPKGNIEFLGHLVKSGKERFTGSLRELVKEAAEDLGD